MIERITLTAAIAAASLLAAEQPTAFTAAQSAAGKIAYASSCGKCHTAKLTGRTGDAGELPAIDSLPANMQKVVRAFKGKVPPLTGEKFLGKWATTKEFSSRIKEAVSGFPPGNTDRETHLNLAAYILEVNGARTGPTALSANTAVEIRTLLP